MYLGIGTDIIKISRIEKFIDNNKDQARDIILAPNERNVKNTQSIAGKYAVKEALLKALGIGFSKGIKRLSEIEVIKDSLGKPTVITYGEVKKIIKRKNIKNIQVSISHDAEYAIAFVICQ